MNANLKNIPTDEDMTEELNKRIKHLYDFSIQTGYGMGFQEYYEWIISKIKSNE